MSVEHAKMGLFDKTGGKPTMPDTPAKKKWDRENSIVFSVKLMNKTEADIIQYLEFCLFHGEGKGTVIKKALREYIESHPLTIEYRYGMRLRGYSPGAQPKGVLRREDDASGNYHDIIVYDRRLSEDEIRDYELEELK